MPLHYDNRDSVVVWVESLGDRFRVSDGGEAFIDADIRKPRDASDLASEARAICEPFGISVSDSALTAWTDLRGLGDTVWRAAMSAVAVANLSHGFRKSRVHHHREHAFVAEVQAELLSRHLPVSREVKMLGSSGHTHRVTIYLPVVHAVLEPIGGEGHFSQISAVYTKFGDLSHADGYRRVSLVDDRSRTLRPDLAGMLVQVSEVVTWTHRADWLERLTR
jgi:hypothetical protein